MAKIFPGCWAWLHSCDKYFIRKFYWFINKSNNLSKPKTKAWRLNLSICLSLVVIK